MHIKKLYEIALVGKEGLGTAYECFVKLKLLHKLTRKKKITTILIYGLPEKYGFSLDFFLFAKQKKIVPDFFETREEKVKTLDSVLKTLKEQKLVSLQKNRVHSITKQYDLILSCEVLQQFNAEERYVFKEMITKQGENIILFVPNKENKQHHKLSGLKGFSQQEIHKWFRDSETGYIDSPPFPPGSRAKKKITNKLFIAILELFAECEPRIPRFIMKKTSHIVFSHVLKK